MHPYILESRDAVASHLGEYLDDAPARSLYFAPWGEDVSRRLRDYALRGKLLRGALVGFGYRLFHTDDPLPIACVEAGAAMELLQSFLLVHDDIMDQDDMRRGGPSVHRQYIDAAPVDDAGRAGQYGISMGICAGDVAAFQAIEQLATLSTDDTIRARITEVVAREISLVGLAQMQDVHHGYVAEAGDDAILDVYTYKTGRYTFSLPMMVGAMLAGADQQTVTALGTLGEHLGRIFQIRDDQLGLFGSEADTGKPSGSDIREDKKTPFRNALLALLPADSALRGVFGAESVAPEQIEAIRAALRDTGAMDRVERLVQHDDRASRELIDRLPIASAGAEALRSLLEYNLSRTV